jgi:hypothetical protein
MEQIACRNSAESAQHYRLPMRLANSLKRLSMLICSAICAHNDEFVVQYFKAE